MADPGDPPHQVGYRSPPQHTKFAKGHSGNPKGRPKGSRNFATVFQTELTRRIAVNEDGRRKKITKQEAVAKQAINQAAAGDLKAIPIVIHETRLYETDPGGGLAQSATTSQEDEMTMASIVRRIVEINMPAAPGNAPETSTEFQDNKSGQENPK